MLDKDLMIAMLEKYDRFLVDLCVSILRQMDGCNPAVEKRIIEFLKEKKFSLPVEQLVNYLEKLPTENVRSRVIDSIWEMHAKLMELVILIGSQGSRQTAYAPLIRMIGRENNPHQIIALATLCCFDFSEAINELPAKFESMGSAMRWVTLILLKSRWDEKFLPVFFKALSDEDSEVVRVAVLAISKANVSSDLEPIRLLLHHQDEMVVLSAVLALADMAAVDSMTELKQLYHRTDNQKIKATIVSAFGDIDHRDTIEFLSQCLSAEDSRVQANAVMALKKKHQNYGELPEEIINRIISLKHGEDHRIKADCIQALWAMGLIENTRDIEKLLNSLDESSRTAGAYLCGKLKLHQLKKQLEILTGDCSWNVRKMAAIALLSYGESGLQILNRLLENGSPDQQVVAAFAVGLSGDSEAMGKIMDQSRSGGEIAEMATGLLLRLSGNQ